MFQLSAALNKFVLKKKMTLCIYNHYGYIRASCEGERERDRDRDRDRDRQTDRDKDREILLKLQMLV